MGAWLKDAEGNDVFDSVNSPLSGEPIFDPISVEQTVGSNSVTRTIDDVDSGLRTLSASTPGGITAGSGIDAIESASETETGTTMNWRESLNVANDRDPDDPRDPPGLGATKALLAAAVVAVALWLLRPLFEIGANVSE